MAVVVLAIAILALCGSVAVWREEVHVSEQVDVADRNAAALQQSLHDVEQRMAAMDTATRELSSRVGTTDAALNAQVDATAVTAKVVPSVFEVDAGNATGTAWVVSSLAGTSLLITNYHVIADVYTAGFRGVDLIKDRITYAGTITRVDEGADLAVLSVHRSLPVLERSAATVSVGEPVVVVGSALGLEGSVSTGIVSGLRTERGRSLIQFTAPVSPGNSGGPVVDRLGQVVGITELKIVEPGAEGLGFAIPVAAVCGSLRVC